MTRDSDQEWRRLTPEHIRRVQAQKGQVKSAGRDGWPKPRVYWNWCRENHTQRLRLEQFNAAMKRGEPVPRLMIEWWIDYVQQKWGWMDCSLEQDSSLVNVYKDPWPTRDDEEETPWPDIFGILLRTLRPDRDMFSRNPEKDAPYTAEMTATWAGRQVGGEAGPGAEAQWLEQGLRIGGWSLAEFSSWLLAMQEAEPRCLMFGVCKGIRVGAPIVVPLTKTAYYQLAEGSLSHKDVKPEHVCSPSRYIWIVAIGEPTTWSGLKSTEIARAQTRCLMYQLAYFSRSKETRRPLILTGCCSPHMVRRCAGLGFRPNGKIICGSDKLELMTLWPPEEYEVRPPFRDRFAYWYMNSVILKLFRHVNKKRWRKSDSYVQ
jgi:hypothetical protein